jgi:hypothetical protein
MEIAGWVLAGFLFVLFAASMAVYFDAVRDLEAAERRCKEAKAREDDWMNLALRRGMQLHRIKCVIFNKGEGRDGE